MLQTPSDSPTLHTPVLIVGAGPAGSALAAELGRFKVPSIILERKRHSWVAPKTMWISPRTMELCRRFGITDAIRNKGLPSDFPQDSVFLTNLNGYEIARIKRAPWAELKSSPYSPEFLCHCPQSTFDPLLQNLAQSFPTNKVFFDSSLDSFNLDCDGINATVTDRLQHSTYTIRADYLIGADGYDSTVRQCLNIDINGIQNLDESLNIIVRIKDLAKYHNKGDAERYITIGPEGTWATIMAVDGHDIWRIMLYGANHIDVSTLDPAASIQRFLGKSIPYEILSTVKWTRRAVVADRFQHDNRIFLVGDSAHVTPPNGGFGMNTGFADAINLGWKLAAIFHEWGGPQLLTSYDQERRPIAIRTVAEGVVDYNRLTAHTSFANIESAGQDGAASREQLGQLLGEANVKAWEPTGIHFGYVYADSPVIIKDYTSLPSAFDPYNYVPIITPGARAPHFTLSDGRSTIDLFVTGYTLITSSPNGSVEQELLTLAAERRLPLSLIAMDRSFDSSPYKGETLIVRPDGHIAWRKGTRSMAAQAIIDTIAGFSSLNFHSTV